MNAIEPKMEEPADLPAPMNGIHFIPKLDPSPQGVLVGGHVNALKQFCRSVKQKTGHRIHLFSAVPSKKIHTFQSNIPDWADFEICRSSAKSQSYQYGLYFLIRAVTASIQGRWKKFNYVHGHSGYIIYSLVTLIIARLNNLRPFHSVYCPVETTAMVGDKKKILASNHIARFALRRMEIVIAMSDNIARSLREIGIPDVQIAVCPPAIDTRAFSPQKHVGLTFRNDQGIPDDAVVIMFVGNLMKSKGLGILLDAFSSIARDTPSAHLLVTLEIAHEGFDERNRDMLAFLKDNHLEGAVTILGIINNIQAAFNSADIFVSPYIDTNGPSDYPIAAMEAMACGVPVIGTRVGAIPELLEDGKTGVLVPPSEPRALEEKLRSLLQDPNLRHKMGERARQRIEENYSIENVYNIMNAIYSRKHEKADTHVQLS